jgi:diaminopimelate decarboxylase
MISFTAKLNEETKDILNNKVLLENIGNMVGYPYSIVMPSAVKENIAGFKSVFASHNMNYRIYFAHKCNQSTAIVKECLHSGINIDVSSLNELKHALQNGFTGNKILATGPKNKEFLWLAIMHGVTISIDSLQELETIGTLAEQLNKSVDILIRINSAESNMVKKSSRFGLEDKDIVSALNILQETPRLNLIGLALHFDTVNIKEKVNGIKKCIKLTDKLLSFGFNIRVLDIGGGYKVNYIEDKNEYINSISEIKENILSSKEELAWNNYSYGLRSENNTLKGVFNSYDFYDSEVKEKYLDSILSSEIDGRQVAEIINDFGLELWIEPGRGLLDNAGLNVSKVNFVKEVDGKTLVGLELNKNQMLMGDHEIFVDPIVLNNNDKKPVFFIGNLCLENDFIFKRKVLVNNPRVDDIVVFVNTAGYYMDFEESTSIMHDRKVKVAVKKEADGFKYYLDDNYNPFL